MRQYKRVEKALVLPGRIDMAFLHKKCHSVLSLSMDESRDASAPCTEQQVSALLSVRGMQHPVPSQGIFPDHPLG